MNIGSIVKWGLLIVAGLWVWSYVSNFIAQQNAPNLGDAVYYPGWPYAAPLDFQPPATYVDNRSWFIRKPGGPRRGSGR